MSKYGWKVIRFFNYFFTKNPSNRWTENHKLTRTFRKNYRVPATVIAILRTKESGIEKNERVTVVVL